MLFSTCGLTMRSVVNAALIVPPGMSVTFKLFVDEPGGEEATGVLSLGATIAYTGPAALLQIAPGVGNAADSFGLLQAGKGSLRFAAGGHELQGGFARASKGQTFSITIRGRVGGASLTMARGDAAEETEMGCEGPFFVCATAPPTAKLRWESAELTFPPPAPLNELGPTPGQAALASADAALAAARAEVVRLQTEDAAATAHMSHTKAALRSAMSRCDGLVEQCLAAARAVAAAAAAAPSPAGPANGWAFSRTFSPLDAPVDAPGVLAFTDCCRRLRVAIGALHPSTGAASPLLVHRSPAATLIADSMRCLGAPSSAAELWRAARPVRFEGEEGVDAGGLTRDWFAAVSAALLEQPFLRKTAAEGRQEYYLNPHATSAADLAMCEFTGGFIARALLESSIPGRSRGRGPIVLGGFRLCNVFFKALLNQDIVLADLKDIDPLEYNSLRAILLEPSVNGMLLGTFVYEGAPLKLNGSRIEVSDSNKQEYAQLKAQRIAYRAVEPQLTAVANGFLDVLGGEQADALLKNSGITASQFRALLCGVEELDWKQLRAHTSYSGSFRADHPVILWLWELVAEWPHSRRVQLLKFVTGNAAVPVDGIGSLGRMEVRSLDDLDKGRLPISHTCFYQLVRSPRPPRLLPAKRAHSLGSPPPSQGHAHLRQQRGAENQAAAGSRDGQQQLRDEMSD